VPLCKGGAGFRGFLYLREKIFSISKIPGGRHTPTGLVFFEFVAVAASTITKKEYFIKGFLY
jgi:hypothetical protein